MIERIMKRLPRSQSNWIEEFSAVFSSIDLPPQHLDEPILLGFDNFFVKNMTDLGPTQPISKA